MSVATKNLSSYVTEKRAVSGFSSIHLRGCGRVRLLQTGTESLEVRAPKRLMDRIETCVKDGSLILGFKKRVFPFFLPMRNRGEIEFMITADVLKELRISGAGSFDTDQLRTRDFRIGVSGAGRITSRGIDADSFHVNISGSGKISFDRLHSDTIRIESSGVARVALDNVSAEAFNVSLSGAGGVKAAGTARQTELRISGAGSLSLENLESAHCKARISGTGKVRVHATESLETSISGAGSVLYKGTPQMSGHTSGSGRVIRIDEE